MSDNCRFPFAYTCNNEPSNMKSLHKVGTAAVSALQKVNNKSFRLGGVCKIIYQASGGSLDWAIEKGNVPYSYGVELRDTGTFGFLLPAKYILPSGEETLAAIVAANLEILNIEQP